MTALEQQFDSLITNNASIILKVCRMYSTNAADRQDLYQEIVLQSWKSFPGFRGDAKFSTWLYRIAINTAFTHQQQRTRRVRTEPIDLVEDSWLPEHTPAEPDRSPDLHQAISQLNEIERAITMLFLEDFSYEEMEAILGIRAGLLRVKMNRIKNKLKKLTHDAR